VAGDNTGDSEVVLLTDHAEAEGVDPVLTDQLLVDLLCPLVGLAHPVGASVVPDALDLEFVAVLVLGERSDHALGAVLHGPTDEGSEHLEECLDADRLDQLPGCLSTCVFLRVHATSSLFVVGVII